MNRAQLEHVLRAAVNIADDPDIVVIGSQAVLGRYADDELPPEATTSIEADLAFVVDSDGAKADRVDGAIGELSKFHESFGYYAQGVSLTTAVLPDGWQDRMVLFAPAGAAPARARCLEPHDCVVAKLVAGREKDLAFARALLRERLVDHALLIGRVRLLPAGERGRGERVVEWVRREAARPIE